MSTVEPLIKDIRKGLVGALRLTAYRVIVFILGLFSPLLWYVLQSEASYDPLVFRLLFSFTFFAFFLFTFAKTYTRLATNLTYILYYVYSFYSVFLIVKNNFASGYLLELVMFIIIICLTFNNKRYLNFYLGAVFVVYAVVVFIFKDTVWGVFANIAILGLFCAAVLVFFDSKIAVENKIEFRDYLLSKIFNETPDGLLLVEEKTNKIFRCNNTASQMFKYDVGKLMSMKVDALFKDINVISNPKDIQKDIEEKSVWVKIAKLITKEKNTFWGSIAITEIVVNERKSWLVRITNIDDQMSIEETLAEKERMLSQIIDLIPHQIYLKDTNHRFVLLNKAVAEANNMKVEEMMGLTDKDIQSEKEAARSFKLEKRIIETGQPLYLSEDIFTDQKGNRKVVQTSKFPFKMEGTGETGILGIHIDVTDKVKDKKLIEENRKMLRQIIDLVPHKIYLKDSKGRFLLVNKTNAEIYGMSPEEMIGKSDFDLFEKAMAEGFKKVEDDILKYNKPRYIPEEESVDLKGVKRYAQTTKIPFYISEIEETGILGVNIDITERKRFEEELRKSELKFKALIENASDIITIVGEDATIKYIGPSVERISGFDPKEVMGQSFFKFVHNDDLELASATFHELLLHPGEKKEITEIKLHSRSGVPMYFEVVGVNLMNDDVVNGIIFNCHNITERKHTEVELTNTNFELDSFVYKASHDLRAPLRSVLGLVNIAKKDNDNPRQEEYLSMMEKSVKGLDDFINDLTQFSRNSRMEVEPTLIDFNELLDEVIDNLKYLENVKSIKVIKKVTNKTPFYSDKNRISTILSNLISNAFKYHRVDIDDPFVNIEIKTGDEGVKISIKDNGIGIDPVYKDRIFEMFFRASEMSYGSGLGLYITKNAVNKLGGAINVESELNVGTSFNVRLPNLGN